MPLSLSSEPDPRSTVSEPSTLKTASPNHWNLSLPPPRLKTALLNELLPQ